MKRILEVIALALAGYVAYELVSRYLGEQAQQKQSGQPQLKPYEAALAGTGGTPTTAAAASDPSRPAPAQLGRVRGAAITGGGSGAQGYATDSDGAALTERVGRGVVRRNKAQ